MGAPDPVVLPAPSRTSPYASKPSPRVPSVRVDAPLPPSASGLTLEPPTITGAGGAELRTFEAWGLPSDGASVVVGCLSTPIPGWVEEMRQPVMARAEGWTARLAEKVSGGPVELRGEGEVRTVHRVAGEGGPRGSAKTLLTFEHVQGEARVVTCGIACAGEERARNMCEGIVRQGRGVGGGAPPPAGISLAAISWAVRHPAPAVAAGIGLAGALLVAVVLLRWRPRSRPF